MISSNNKKKLQIIFLGFFVSIISTIYIFNFASKDLNFRFLIILFIYFISFILFKRFTGKSNRLIFISLITAPIFIDMSVLITNLNLVPIRFPISTFFIILGCALGIAINKSNIIKFLSIIVVGFYFFFSTYFIVPISLFNDETTSRSFNPDFLSSKFLKPTGDTIDLLQSKDKPVLIDFMFVGCAPCELKRNLLSEIDQELNQLDFDIYIICNGNISSFEKFQRYFEENPEFGRITFLYDFNNSISTFFPNSDIYPFEVFLNESKIFNSYVGISNETYYLHKKDRIRSIKKLLNE